MDGISGFLCRMAIAVSVAIPLSLVGGPASAQAGVVAAPVTLTMLTTIQKENLRLFKQAFEADNPDIRLAIRTMANGMVTDALMAQTDVARVDVVWGLSASSMIQLRDAGLLLPYAPAEAGDVLAAFKDSGEPPTWIGGGVWTTALCAGTALGGRTPAAWTDLVDPRFRNRIAMPSPITSGAGLALLAGWIFTMGEAAAWDFMDDLDANVLLYTQDSNKPCRMVATKAVDVGLSYDFRAYTTQAQTGAVVPVYPPGLGWDVSAVGILAATGSADAARRFADWSASSRARAFYSGDMNFSMVASGEVSRHLTHLPADLPARLAPIDFAWLAANRERLVSTWLRRYGAKLETPTAP